MLFNLENARSALGALSLGLLMTIFLTLACGATSLIAGVFVARLGKCQRIACSGFLLMPMSH